MIKLKKLKVCIEHIFDIDLCILDFLKLVPYQNK